MGRRKQYCPQKTGLGEEDPTNGKILKTASSSPVWGGIKQLLSSVRM